MYTDEQTYIYTHLNICIHKYIHIYACNIHKNIQNMSKQNIHGNIHGHTHLLNL